MHRSKPLSIACGLLTFASAAHAGDTPACAPKTIVSRIAQLPAEVQAELDSMGPVSDPGGAFSESDVVDAVNPVPTQRLISGQAGPDCILLKIEKGGRSYAHGVLRFDRVDGRWVMASLLYEPPPRR